MKKNALLLCCLTLFLCCKDPNAYEKFYNNFDENHWEQTDKKEFEFTIADDAPYDIMFQLSHVYGYQFPSLPLHVAIINPAGQVEELPLDVPITDKDGESLGDCAGDICDLNFNIKNNVRLPRGNYKIVISNTFNGPYLPNIIGIGLSVKHSR